MFEQPYDNRCTIREKAKSMIHYLAMVLPELQPIKDISVPRLQVHCKCTCTYTNNTDHIQYSSKKTIARTANFDNGIMLLNLT
jgi:hypothetical protein